MTGWIDKLVDETAAVVTAPIRLVQKIVETIDDAHEGTNE